MIDVACGVMYNKDNKILMGKRMSKNDNYPNKWEFPGGQKEDNENIHECLKREWMEELNLHISIEQFLCTTTHKDISCHFFVGKIQDIENLRINVHEYIGFYPKNALYRLRLFEGDDKIVDLLD